LGEESQHLFLDVPANDDPEKLFDTEIDKVLMNEALSHLDKKYRDVLLLRYGEDKDYRQISDILEIPEGTVATLIHRGKAALKKFLTKES
jgi:RNA polymerase sigma-70 factor (ECF subfamily)